MSFHSLSLRSLEYGIFFYLNPTFLKIPNGFYKRRFRGDEEPGIGRGSTWEGTIIRQHLYNNQLESTKFIPVVFSSQDLTRVPIIFNGHDKYILEDEKSFRDLSYRLRKEPIVVMPEVATAKLQAPPEPKFFSPQKPKAEPPPVLLDITEIQEQTAVKPEEEARRKQEELEQPPDVPLVAPSPSPLPTALFEFEVATITKGSLLKKPEVNRTLKRSKSYTADLGNNIFLEMVAIPGGSFRMGSTESDSEQPIHAVTVAPFFLGRYPITQAQWRVVAGFDKVKHDLQPDPSSFKGGDRPVEKVSWWEAVEFCDRLSRKTNRTHRLPSEAEWEYACRAGTTTPFHFGEIITTDLANYYGNETYNSSPKGQYRKETTTVGSFGVANAFGLYDMHGNVGELCADHWHENYAGAPIDGSAWLTADQNAERLLRGGSWRYKPRLCRSAGRDQCSPNVQSHGIGFRVVCVSSWTA